MGVLLIIKVKGLSVKAINGSISKLSIIANGRSIPIDLTTTVLFTSAVAWLA